MACPAMLITSPLRPPMAMVPELKKSYQNYLANNFKLNDVKDEEIFLVGGTREGTFSAIQTMVNREAVSVKPYVCCHR